MPEMVVYNDLTEKLLSGIYFLNLYSNYGY